MFRYIANAKWPDQSVFGIVQRDSRKVLFIGILFSSTLLDPLSNKTTSLEFVDLELFKVEAQRRRP